MENILAFEKFEVGYLDNFFVKLCYEGEDETKVEKRENLPEDIAAGDKVQKFFDKEKKLEYYRVIEKSENADNSKSKLIEDFAAQNNIKKVVSAEVSNWVIVGLFGHTICLANIENMGERRYEPDVKLELNARRGDLYYFLHVNKKSGYVYNNLTNTDVCLEYAKMLRGKLTEEDMLAMEKLTKKHAKLFNRSYQEEYDNSWCLEEMASENVFSGVDENYEDKPIKKEELPSIARLGDFVAIDGAGKYVFDRVALLDHLENLSNLAKGVK